MSNHTQNLSLQWRHNGRDGVSNHQPHDCLLHRLFRHRSKKTSKLHVTGLCMGNSPHQGPVMQKCFHLMASSWLNYGWIVLLEIRIKDIQDVFSFQGNVFASPGLNCQIWITTMTLHGWLSTRIVIPLLSHCSCWSLMQSHGQHVSHPL